jgi:hypothetical protein
VNIGAEAELVSEPQDRLAHQLDEPYEVVEDDKVQIRVAE